MDGTCTYSATKASSVGVATFTKTAINSVAALQAATYQQPVSVSIAASTNYFQSYTSGVLTSVALCGTAIDHAVLTTGYGSLNGVNYFIVRNSWSASWGN